MSTSPQPNEPGIGGDWRPIQADLAPRLLDAAEDAVVRQVATDLAATVRQDSESLASWLGEVFPELNRRNSDTTALVASVTDNLHTMWEAIAGGLCPEQVEPPPNALLWPRKMVHDNVPVSVLLRVYYVGHAMIWHRWAQPRVFALATTDTDIDAVCARLHADTFTYLDRAAQRVAEHYEAEQDELFASGARSRAAVVYDILAGTSPTPAMQNVLGFALRDRHCAWVLWASGCRLDGPRELLAVAEAVHTVLGCGGRLSVAHGPNEVWGWTAGPVETTAHVREQLRDVLESRLPASSGASVAPTERTVEPSVRGSSGLHLAVSTPGSGQDGFRDGNSDARSIQAAVSRAGFAASTVHTSREAGLAALLLSDPAAARRFVRTQLGTLAADDENTGIRRRTVLEFLTNGGSYSRAAAALGVHRNTVLYRLQRASRDIGREIELPEHNLAAALLIAAWLPRTEF